MTSRQRVLAALNHQEPDQVPLDIGASDVTGITASSLSQLRLALGLDQPGDRIKVVDCYQMLGEVTDDLCEALGIDTMGIVPLSNQFGIPNENWKPWELPDGTPVLMPEKFNTEPEPNGELLQYPQGDKSAPPSGRMPAGGYYCDAIVHQEPIDPDKLDPADNLEEFNVYTEDKVDYLVGQARRLSEDTDYAVMFPSPGSDFAAMGGGPAPALKHPKGIRDIEEWLISIVTRRDYLYQVFEGQCEIALRNLELVAPNIGHLPIIMVVTGADFGTQSGPFISPQTYRELFKPFHKSITGWIHRNTSWLTFIHTCGGVEPLIEDFIDAGFDILNPVQCSADGMEPRHLKEEYGEEIAFWGGGVDTQKTLPFGTPDEVRREVLERLEIFAPGGGYVFNPIHNIQPKTPVENLLAMFEALREFNG